MSNNYISLDEQAMEAAHRVMDAAYAYGNGVSLLAKGTSPMTALAPYGRPANCTYTTEDYQQRPQQPQQPPPHYNSPPQQSQCATTTTTTTENTSYTGRAKVEWDKHYKWLADYRKKSGDCYFLNPSQYPNKSTNQVLALWVKNQRRLRKKLTDVQKRKLDKLNFDWSDQRTMAFRNRSPDKANQQYKKQWMGYQPRNNHDKWLYMFAKLQAFKEEFGHVDSESIE